MSTQAEDMECSGGVEPLARINSAEVSTVNKPGDVTSANAVLTPQITISDVDSGTEIKRVCSSDCLESRSSSTSRCPSHLRQQHSCSDVDKFFDNMGVDRSVIEPMLSVQCSHLRSHSSSSLNLLESASTAGCILDTDQDNCDHRSDLALLEGVCPVLATAAELRNKLVASGATFPDGDWAQERVMEWLTHVSPSVSTSASTEDLKAASS